MLREKINEKIQQLKGNSLIHRFIALLSVDVLSKVIMVVTIPLFLKVMSRDSFGLYNYLFSVVSLLAVLLTMGFHVSLSKLYLSVSSSEERGDVLFTINTLLVFFVAIIFVLFFCFDLDFYLIDVIFKNNFDYSSYRQIILISVITSLYSGIILNFLITSQRIKQVSIFNILKTLAYNFVPLVALYFFKDYDQAITRIGFSFGAESLLVLYFLLFIYRKEFSLRFKPELALRSLKISFPYFIATIPSSALLFLDKYILEKHVNFSDLSVYFLAFGIAGILSMLANSFNNVWFPEVFKIRDSRETLLKTKKVSSLLFGIYLLLGFGLYFAVWIALQFGVFDESYSEILIYLPFFVLSRIFLIVSNLFNILLVHIEKTYIYAIVNILIIGPLYVINDTLVELYSVLGSAIASLITGLLNLFIFYTILRVILHKRAVIQD